MPEKYYIHYNHETGDLQGNYCCEIHGDNIPEPNIEADVDTWQKLLAEQGRWKVDENTKKFVPVPVPEPTKDEKLARLKTEYLTKMDNLITDCEACDKLGESYDVTKYEAMKAEYVARKKEIEEKTSWGFQNGYLAKRHQPQ